jgi:hypothetical protein
VLWRLWKLRETEANAGIESSNNFLCRYNRGICDQPKESFNADANIGHRFAILMANVGALRASRSGAG